MAKPHKTLREGMSLEAQRRAAERADEIVKKCSVACPGCHGTGWVATGFGKPNARCTCNPQDTAP